MGVRVQKHGQVIPGWSGRVVAPRQNEVRNPANALKTPQ